VNLVLDGNLMEKIVAHARSTYPMEGCGLLAGKEYSAERFIPITNRLASATAFDMDPSELIAAHRSMRESGESLVAIYHSHPQGPARPSRVDIQQAYYPAAYIIVSLASRENPAVHGFRIIDGAAVEIELHVIV
jgi:proteasome lid subunit RPN8/RPN11